MLMPGRFLGTFVEQQVNSTVTGLCRGRVGGFGACLDQQQSGLGHATPHFTKAIGGGIFRPSGGIGKEGFLENFQSVFLQPGQMMGRLPGHVAVL